MAELDLEEIFESILKGDSSSIFQAVEMLVQLWAEEDFESVEIFAEEILDENTPKSFLTQILTKKEEMPDFVEDFVAAIDGKRIVDLNDFQTLMKLES